MFSERSTDSWAELQLPGCPSKQGELSENMLQNLLLNLPPQTVRNRNNSYLNLSLFSAGCSRILRCARILPCASLLMAELCTSCCMGDGFACPNPVMLDIISEEMYIQNFSFCNCKADFINLNVKIKGYLFQIRQFWQGKAGLHFPFVPRFVALFPKRKLNNKLQNSS